MLCACFSEAPQSIQQSLHKSPARAPANSSPVPTGSVFIWTAGVTCRRTARTARMRETVVRYLSPSPGVVKPQQRNKGVFCASFIRSSGLHHVSVDSVERLQCVLWSRLPVSAEGHSEGGDPRRHLQWCSIRQPGLFSSRMSRSIERTLSTNNLLVVQSSYVCLFSYCS